MTRSLFDTARQYRESFDVTGSKKSFEWQQVENEEPVIHTKSTPEQPIPEPEIPKRVKVPDYASRLPGADPPVHAAGGDPGRRRTCPSCRAAATAAVHPHLAHNFLMAVLGEQPAFPDAATSANWTMVGLCAHESAMKGGERVKIPVL